MARTVGSLAQFWREESGAAATEYALLLAIIAAGLALAAGTLGSAFSSATISESDCIEAEANCP